MRERGVLLHVSGLPSRRGIGALGEAAYGFADFLAEAGQDYWQMLPLGPAGYGDSPYQAFSAFAGNPYFIDLDLCVSAGLTGGKRLPARGFGNGAKIDYGKLFAGRLDALRFIYGCARYDKEEAAAFEKENAGWLEDYALFAALKIHFGHVSWDMWPDDIRRRESAALAEYSERLKAETAFQKFTQYLFFSQFNKLKEYAAGKGVRLIGDIPIYAGYDSADVWARPEMFFLDESLKMKAVAGVPPDYFSADGQVWGNPLFDWEYLKKDGYGWWLNRLAHAFKLFDMVRIDHFRGFESYFAIPAGEKTARNGTWEKGPGMDLFGLVNSRFPGAGIIAEDLGETDDAVNRLIADAGYPGMRVLQFAFDGNPQNPHLPVNYNAPCVAYTGTHDNRTARAWYSSLKAAEKALVRKVTAYSPEKHKNMAAALIETALRSPAELAVIPMQDYLNLGAGARMNSPSVPQGNWRWRLKPGQLTMELAAECRRMGR